jgi:hypothetical protein
MGRSEEAPEIYTPEEIRAWRRGWEAGMDNNSEAKSRYDRYVCAVASGSYVRHPDLLPSSEEIAMNALLLMLAADKRWEEHTATTKGGEDGRD